MGSEKGVGSNLPTASERTLIEWENSLCNVSNQRGHDAEHILVRFLIDRPAR